MNEMIKCPKHNTEFEITKGCPECLAEMWKPDAAGPYYVKVSYISEKTQELSEREYTYFADDPLKVGYVVSVPVRDTTTKAKVTAINVPAIEIEAFKDKVKTIPPGASIPAGLTTEAELTEAGASEASTMAEEPDVFTLPEDLIPETALALPLGADVEVMSYFEEAQKLQQYAEARVIKTAEDVRVATDDLTPAPQMT